MKNVLVVNYDFPPAGGAGIKRCLKFIKYLPKYGWHCDVLTVKNGNHAIIDISLLEEVEKSVKVYRSFTLESMFPQGDQGKQEPQKGHEAKRLRKGWRKYLRSTYKFMGQYLKIPDSRILWIPSALLTGIVLTLKKKFDVIYATGPTFVNLVLGALIKMISGKPLVVDFRDAWIGDPMLINSVSKSRLKYHSLLEKYVIIHADLVISTNPFVNKDFEQRYPQGGNKYKTIYNGFDMDDFNVVAGMDWVKTNKFRVVYTGRLYGERTPLSFLKALRLAIDEMPELKDNIDIKFVGSMEPFQDGKMIENYLRELNLSNFVGLTGHISRKESLTYQMNANLLLLIIGIVPSEMSLTYGISGKLFDYLIGNKPILALANEGATREFLIENKLGNVFYHEDLQGVKEHLMKTYKNWKNGDKGGEEVADRYKKFDFRLLTKQLADCLDDMGLRDRT